MSKMRQIEAARAPFQTRTPYANSSIPTGEGWLYLAIVKDLCARKIVGYARRKPNKGLIFHRAGFPQKRFR